MKLEEKKRFDSLHCPSCGCNELVLTELWVNHSVQFEYENGKIISTGNLDPGYPYKVEAQCVKCSHEWRLRGITLIPEDIIN